MGKRRKLWKSSWGLKIYRKKNQLSILNDGRHTRTSGTSKSAIDLTIASPSLQPILSWYVTDSSKCSDHCMITVSIQSKNSEPQTTITKFNINKANWHLLTSNETWKKVTDPVRSQSAEPLTKDFYKENPILAQNNKKEDWEKFARSLNCNTPINQAWNIVRQLKGKSPKKVTILEVNGAQ